jgi:hypothetical protein
MMKKTSDDGQMKWMYEIVDGRRAGGKGQISPQWRTRLLFSFFFV